MRPRDTADLPGDEQDDDARDGGEYQDNNSPGSMFGIRDPSKDPNIEPNFTDPVKNNKIERTDIADPTKGITNGVLYPFDDAKGVVNPGTNVYHVQTLL